MDTQSTTIRIPKDAYQRLRKAAFDMGISQNALVVAKLQDWLDSPCPDCGHKVGALHHPVCDMAICPATGLRRLICRDMKGHDCGDVTWKGWGQ